MSTAEKLDPNESDAILLWAEIARLKAAAQGPDGFASWQEAATAERIRRVKSERAAEKLAEALEELHTVCALALAGKDGLQYANFESRSGHFVSAAPSMAKAESALAAYRAKPAADGAQRVERMSNGIALELARAHLDKGLSWAPHITRCNDLEIKALIRAIETHLAAAWGVKLDGDGS